MKLAAFNLLTVAETLADVQALPVGTYFLWDVLGTYGNSFGESAQQGNTSLRHKITYHQRVAADANSLAGQGALIYRRVFDILESDDLGQSSKTALKPKINTAPERDDNDRNFIKEGDWS